MHRGVSVRMKYWMKRHVTNMDRKSILVKARGRLATTLILFELILSVIFLLVGHLIGSAYVRGVGVGLIIAWVTGALAYFVVRRKV